jgi:type IV secretion system protein VirB3
MQLRTVPIRRSLHRDNLIAGCERELVIITGMITFALIVVGQSLATALYGVVLWSVSLFFLRKMGNKDTQLSKTYFRHSRYQSFYSAKAKNNRRT